MLRDIRKSAHFLAKYISVALISLSFVVVPSLFAANPSAPFTPTDNVLDPNCLPTDSNCYVSISKLSTTTISMLYASSTLFDALVVSNPTLYGSSTANILAVFGSTTLSALFTVGGNGVATSSGGFASGAGFTVTGNTGVYGECIAVRGTCTPTSGHQGTYSYIAFENDRMALANIGNSGVEITTGAGTVLVADNLGRVGIGTSTSPARFTVQATSTVSTSTVAAFTNASGTSLFTILASGNLGIGNSAPSTLLDITGASTTGILSSEMITSANDRDFTAANNWTYNSGWTQDIVTGKASTTASSAGTLSIINTFLSPVPSSGNAYQVSFDVNSFATGTLNVSFGSTTHAFNFGNIYQSSQSQSVIFEVTGTGALTFTPSATWLGTIDNVSIKRISVASVIQTIRNSDGTTGLEIRSGGSSTLGSFIGYEAGKYNTTGAFNTFTGYQSGKSNTTSSYNTFTGYQSGFYNTTGANNVFMGYQAGLRNTTGSNNNFIGYNAGANNTTGSSNVFLGWAAGAQNTTGYTNTFIGHQAGSANTTGANNILLGYGAAYQNTTGSVNVAIGIQAGANNTTGSSNIFIGHNAAGLNTTGSSNIAIGSSALGGNVSGTGNSSFGHLSGIYNLGSNNSFFGFSAGEGYGHSQGYSSSVMSNNSVFGYQSGYNLATSTGNILFGYKAGFGITTGSRNIVLGYDIDVASTTSYQLNIGNLIFGTNLDGVGSSVSTGNIGIGTSTPSAKFSIQAASGYTGSLLDIASTTSSSYATSSLFTVLANGNVGIGSSTPISTLSLIGTVGKNPLTIASSTGASFLTLNQSGFLGLNTASPSTLLDITGTSTTGLTSVELITNTDDRQFTVDTGAWSGTNWTIDAGNNDIATHTAGNNTLTLASSTPTVGNYYRITFTIDTTATGSPGLSVTYGGTTATPRYGVSNTGVQSNQVVVIRATSTAPLTFTPNNATWTGTIDAVSIIQITPSSVSQTIRNSNGTAGVELRAGGTGLNNTFVGKDSGLYNTTGHSNSFFGNSTGYSNTDGAGNTINGYRAFLSNTTGSYNTAIGYDALYSNVSGSQNAAFGKDALYSNTTGSSNYAFGSQALYSNTTGSNNSAFGSAALYSNTTGNENVANGPSALQLNTTGLQNTANGVYSLFFNTTGSYNTATGWRSLYSNTSGTYNTADGYQALLSNTTGTNNTASGYGALYNGNATSSTAFGVQAGYGSSGQSKQNVSLFGYRAGYSLSTGSNNQLFGYQAGDSITSGQGNVVLGYDSDVASTTGNNQLSIGNLIYGTGLDGTGSTVSSGNIGIGTTTPESKLDVYNGTSATSTDVFRIISNVTSNYNPVFKVKANGDIFTDGSVTIGTPADIAESYSAEGHLEAGDVVTLSTSTIAWSPGGSSATYGLAKIRKAHATDVALGVVSTNPGLVLGNNIPVATPIALTGRIPVKVTNESGPIAVGDYLTLSTSTPGYAMRLTSSGRGIGKALSSFVGDSFATGTVIVYVENKDHTVIITGIEGLSELFIATSTATSSSSALTQITLALQSNITVIKSFVALRITAAVAYIDTIFAKEVRAENITGDRIEGKSICVEDVCVTKSQFSQMLQQSNITPTISIVESPTPSATSSASSTDQQSEIIPDTATSTVMGTTTDSSASSTEIVPPVVETTSTSTPE